MDNALFNVLRSKCNTDPIIESLYIMKNHKKPVTPIAI